MNEGTLRDTIISLARRYAFEEGHSLQDERLALRIFDELTRLGLLPSPGHHLEQGEGPGANAEEVSGSAQHPDGTGGCSPRDILSCAAILHDIGYVEGYEQHHKTAFRLLLAAPIPGLSPREQVLVAHVARYHRGSIPDAGKHEAFAELSPEDQRLVCQLGAILRFADGLDRTHINAVQDLRCTLEGDRLVVTLLPGVNDEIERWAGAKKARWFESVFGVRVELQ